MLDKFKAYIFKLDPKYRDKKFLLAVSGGVDSMLLLELFYQSKLDFAIAHCNYKLRKAASEEDERFVLQKGIQKGITVYIKQFNTKEIILENNARSLQMVARDLRYKWFYDLESLHKFDYITTAHHLNDSIETFIYNFSQGTGIKGLSGIPIQNGKIIRPLSNFSKSEILNFAMEINLPYREDDSNAKNDYKRNQIRNKVIPAIEDMNPKFISNAGKSIKYLKEARLIYEEAIRTARENIVSVKNGYIYIDVAGLRNHITPSTLLFEILNAYGFSYDSVESIMKIGAKGTGQQFFSDQYQMLFDRSQLMITTSVKPIQETVIFSPRDEVVTFDGVDFELALIKVSADFELKKDKHIAYLDLDTLIGTMAIRTWREGDKFQPLGMNGKHQKLQDFFINSGINRIEKERIPIFTINEKICWVSCHRIDERFKVTHATKTILRVTKFSN